MRLPVSHIVENQGCATFVSEGQWWSQPKNFFWGGKIFDFRRTTQNSPKIFGGTWPLSPLLATPMLKGRTQLNRLDRGPLLLFTQAVWY